MFLSSNLSAMRLLQYGAISQHHHGLVAYLLVTSTAGLHILSFEKYLDLDPVSLLAFLLPTFTKLGWYRFTENGSPEIHKSIVALIIRIPWDINDAVEDFRSVPPDKDAVWEPAVYPHEWPPLPAPTWSAAWDAAEVESRFEGLQREETHDSRKPFVAKEALTDGIRKLVFGKICVGGDTSGNDVIEMV
ncbi:hypothetical protein CYLTODRAFT_488647 [Cylindrobasidium torrendii FP15055 ss-10]|uniref:Uncharacterized protein n=1 Tax=Cylindrobasidium torrendii FP15055 ss-10 TaxID=1314674 RepID=A0A0D7BHY1_9AGAR|nr:hypothetical protein CYLTODRAFT_488647 [Cylindrobasidium torrendii FP15055 ss-10]